MSASIQRLFTRLRGYGYDFDEEIVRDSGHGVMSAVV